jgi:hypothetical protein
MADPHVISALREKRALVAGLIEKLERKLEQYRADLTHIDGVLRLFQPDRDPGDIKPKRTYARCDTAQRDYDAIEKTHNNSWLLSRDAAGVAAKRERLSGCGPLRGFVGTVSEAVDLIDQYQNAGVQLLINSDYRNDMETHELMAAEVMPQFACRPIRASLRFRRVQSPRR